MTVIRHRLNRRGAHRRSWSRACAGSMACERHWWLARSGVKVAVGLVTIALLLLQVGLANGIVSRRRAIASLSGDRDYLVTRVGELELSWHRLTDRETIVARARRELGMVPADGPLPPVVVAMQPAPRRLPLWHRLLAAVGSGRGVTPVAAQESRP